MQCMQCKICNRKCFWSDNSFHIIDKLQSFHKRVNELSNDYLFLSCSKFLFLNISEILRSALCLLCLVLYLNYFREHILPPLHFLIISYTSAQKTWLKCFRFYFSWKINEPKLVKSYANDSSESLNPRIIHSCLTLCKPMDSSRPGFPVHHQLPAFTQTHVIELVMPSNHLILCRPLLLPPSIFPSIRVFSNESQLHIRWLKFWGFSFNISLSSEYSGLISFRMDWLGSPCCPGDSQESSPTTQFKSINSLVLSFLYRPTLTSIHDYWKNHSFE